MNILVGKNGTQLGPFSLEEVTTRLNAGEFAPTDYGWHEGMTAWEPLSQLVARGASTTAPAVMLPGNLVPAASVGTVGTVGAGSSGYAGFWLRVAAYIIDFLVTLIPSFVVGFIIGIVVGSGGEGHSKVGSQMLANLLGIVITWIYFAYMESSPFQATLGKMALNLKVTDLSGGRITFGRATGRHFGKIVSGIILGVGFMMAGFTERKQALHDLMADCLVVRK